MLPEDYAIRAYMPHDAIPLAAVEVRASGLFAEFGFPTLVPDPPTAPEAFHSFASAYETFVAEHALQGPAGYAVLHPLGNFLHLRELAVHPDHGRRGIGAALLHMAVAKAMEDGRAGVSLSTFRDLPFNERFYAAHGFVECPLEEAPHPLARQFYSEVPPGIAPEVRLLMLRRTERGN